MRLKKHAMQRKLAGFKVAGPNAPWEMRDKINSIQQMIISADSERCLQIDLKYKELIRVLRAIEFNAGRSLRFYDKRSKFRHIISSQQRSPALSSAPYKAN